LGQVSTAINLPGAEVSLKVCKFAHAGNLGRKGFICKFFHLKIMQS
jgi:hypothetical protein